MSRKTPLTREQAKRRARRLQAQAPKGAPLGYQKALGRVAAAAGYATVNEMYAQYEAAAALPLPRTDTGIGGLAAELLRPSEGYTLLLTAERADPRAALRATVGHDGLFVVHADVIEPTDISGILVIGPDRTVIRHPVFLTPLAEAIARGARVVVLESIEIAHPRCLDWILQEASERRVMGVDIPDNVALVLHVGMPDHAETLAAQPSDLRPERLVRLVHVPEQELEAIRADLHPALADFLGERPDRIADLASLCPIFVSGDARALNWVVLSKMLASGLALADIAASFVGKEAAADLDAWLSANGRSI